MQNVIRTVLVHQRKSSQERGFRFWDAAQVQSPIWFLLETKIEGEEEIQRWIATSIQHAVQLQKNLGLCIWARIFVYLYSPNGIRDTPLFEEVIEAHQYGSTDAYIYQLGNAMTFTTGSDTQMSYPLSHTQLRIVYARKAASCY